MVLQKTIFCFDVSVWEIFWPLISGAKLIIVNNEDYRDAEVLKATIESHQITNVLIDVHDGDHAVSEAYVTALVRTNPQDGKTTDFVARGRYLDRWSRRSGTWAIDHRQYVDDVTEVHEFSVAEVGDGSAPVGRRDQDDPSYALFAH